MGQIGHYAWRNVPRLHGHLQPVGGKHLLVCLEQQILLELVCVRNKSQFGALNSQPLTETFHHLYQIKPVNHKQAGFNSSLLSPTSKRGNIKLDEMNLTGFNHSYILLTLRKIFKNMKNDGWHMQTQMITSLQL